MLHIIASDDKTIVIAIADKAGEVSTPLWVRADMVIVAGRILKSRWS